MRHLLIVCHPKRQSFTQAVARAYAEAVKALGDEAIIRDLYRLGFDPILRERELLDAKKSVIPTVVRQEQRLLAEAETIAFFYPLWWAFMPAMMKGYFDRVLSSGFAYDFKGDDMIPRLADKTAMIFTSSGADMAYLRRSKQWDAMRVLEEDHILSLCGIELIEHMHFPSVVPGLPKLTTEKHLARVGKTVQKYFGATRTTRTTRATRG
jgi:NAD(P)H dehydrogenase (quinone)